MIHETTLGNDDITVHFEADEYIPARLWGHPDNWAPAEGGEIEIVLIERKTNGQAWIDGKWVKTDKLIADITTLVSDEEIERIKEEIIAGWADRVRQNQEDAAAEKAADRMAA